jgi:biotin-[acetyl-CoA-carboxylase] ligase BirA-like protein
LSASLSVIPAHRLLHLADVGSTMDEAAALVREGDLGPVWIVADHQTKGRGRLGRHWVSPAGNLYTTFLSPAPVPVRDQPKLGFAFGVALCAAINATLGDDLARLKWPNEVLIGEAKVAGLLMEGLGGGAAIAVGMGVNIVSAPGGLPYPACSMKELNQHASRPILLMNLSTEVARMTHLFVAEGFRPLRELWLARAVHVGRTVTVNRPGGPVTGRFADLDHEGRLVLDDGGARHVLSAGDVVVSPSLLAGEGVMHSMTDEG